MENILTYGIGFLAQGLYFLRTITQWFKSEQEGKVVSPTIFWQLSLLASLLMFTYGILRDDFAIIVGQTLVYAIYVRNLQLKGAWQEMHWAIRTFAILIPLGYWIWLIRSGNFISILKTDDISLFWKIWGTAAQVIFTSRFLYQWIYSEKRKESVLPRGYWILGGIGTVMIFIYSIARKDPVLFAAHVFGLFIYVRNILLSYGKSGIVFKIDHLPVIEKIMSKVSDKIE